MADTTVAKGEEIILKPRALKEKKDVDQFSGKIKGLKIQKNLILDKLYQRFIASFRPSEDGGAGRTVHMEYMASYGHLVKPLVAKLKANGLTPQVFTNLGMKIVAVDLSNC